MKGTSAPKALTPPAHHGAAPGTQLRIVDPKAADGSRTRDLELGKLALYQLSYRRIGAECTQLIPFGLGSRRSTN